MANLTRLLRKILVIIVAAGLNLCAAASWTAVNSGLPAAALSVNALIVDPASPSIIYAQTFRGLGGPAAAPALFKSTDAGGTWSMVSSIVSVTALVIDLTNSSTLYAATPQGVLKSTNGGATWIDVSKGMPDGPVNRLLIDPINPSTLYALVPTRSGASVLSASGLVNTIFKTTNGGASWEALDTGVPPGASINLLAIDPAVPSTLYALVPPFFSRPPVNGAPPKGSILKSTDGGESWNTLDIPLPPGPPAAFFTSLVIDSSSTIYAVLPSFAGPAPGAAVLKSADGGATWKSLSALPPNTSIGTLFIDPTAASTLYAFGSSFTPPGPPSWRILKSTDGGEHWNTFDAGLPANTFISSLAVDSTGGVYIGYSGNLAPGPFSPPAPAASGGVFKSTDGLQSWTDAGAGLISFDIRALAVNPAVSTVLYAGGDGGVFRSSDGGGNWNPTGVTSYTGALVTDSLNPNLLYAETGKMNGCSSDERLLLGSPDGGVSWTDSISPLNSGCILSVTVPSLRAAPMVTGAADSRILYLAESDDQDGYSALLKSTDGGANWSTLWDSFQDLRVSVRALAIDSAHPTTLYAGLDDGTAAFGGAQLAAGSIGLFKSADAGATWTNTSFTRSAVNLLAIDPANPNIVYASTEGHYGDPKGFQGLFKSTDGGARWQPINKGLDSVIGSRLITSTALKIDLANSNILYLGTSNSGVFRSVDGGAMWSAINDGLTNLQIRALDMARGGARTVYAATSGGVFKISDQ